MRPKYIWWAAALCENEARGTFLDLRSFSDPRSALLDYPKRELDISLLQDALSDIKLDRVRAHDDATRCSK